MQDASSLQVSLFPSGPLLHLVKLVGALDVPPRGQPSPSLKHNTIQLQMQGLISYKRR